jgi:hypothetical protein
LNGNELNCSNIDAWVKLRKNDQAGEPVPKNVLISTNKRLLTIIPENPLELATSYYLALEAGLSDYSENELESFETSFSTVLTSSIKTEIPELKIYPNPVSDVLNISGDFSGFQTLQVFNAQGRICLEKEIQETKSINLNIAYFPKGIYMLHFITDKNRIVKKIIKY